MRYEAGPDESLISPSQKIKTIFWEGMSMLNTILTWISLMLVSVFAFEHVAVASHVIAHISPLSAIGLVPFAFGGVNDATYYSTQFANTVQLLLQQKGSRLRMAVTEGSYIGEKAQPVDQIGVVEMSEVVDKFAPKQRTDEPTDTRWIFPTDCDLDLLFDSFDKLKMAVDPMSAKMQSAVNAAGRKYDRLILAGALSDNKTGVNAGTTTSFLAGNIIAENFGSASDVSLTVHKVREARRILRSYDVDEDDPMFMAVNSIAEDSMLAEAQVISLDYNDKPVLVEGKISRFLGVNFIHTELVTLTDTDDRQIPLWVKSGLHLGVWKDQEVDVSQRKDLKGNPWEIYMLMSAGATRLEEKKVINILCEE